jgi:hypothetical protein
MTTFTILLLIISGLIACCLLVLLFAPVSLGAEFAFSASGRKGTVYMQFLHPSLAQWKYDIVHQRSEVKVLRWIHLFPEAGNCAQEQEETAKATGIKSAVSPVAGFTREAAETPREGRSFAEKYQETSRPGEPNVLPEQTAGLTIRSWRKIKYLLSLLYDSRNRRAAVKTLNWCRRMLGFCCSIAGLQRIQLHAKAGTGDPAETGKIYGYYTAFNSSFLSLQRNVDVRFIPEFSGNRFDCCASVTFRTSLTRIVFPFFAGLVTFPYSTAYFTWRRIKKLKYPEES